LDNNQWHCRYC